MIPYDGSMVLSLGETQATRLGGILYKNRSSPTRSYAPFWRLNTCLDNFRLYMGRSENSPPRIHKKYIDFYAGHYNAANAEGPDENVYAAMRYHISNTTYPDHPDDHEPEVFFSPPLEKGAEILSCGSRIYYPRDKNGTSYLRMKLLFETAVSSYEIFPDSLTWNEQVFFFLPRKFNEDRVEIAFQYKAYKPMALDANLETPKEDDSNPYSFKYRPRDGTHKDLILAIPWIKEINLRSIPARGVQFLSWDEK
jgi:hypothetical protein